MFLADESYALTHVECCSRTALNLLVVDFCANDYSLAGTVKESDGERSGRDCFHLNIEKQMFTGHNAPVWMAEH